MRGKRLPADLDRAAHGPTPTWGTAVSTATTTAPVRTGLGTAIVRRWPSVVGLSLAVSQLILGTGRESLAITITVAVVCYLAAAAMDRPWVAWAAVGGTSVVVTLSEVAGLPWWVALGAVAIAMVATGLALRVPRSALAAQSAAALGFGGLAAASLVLAPKIGLVLAGIVLASHAVWDVVHWRRNKVVPRSLAEFCLLLDVPLGIGAVLLAITG